MSLTTLILLSIAVVVLVAVAAVIAATETALTRVSRSRAEALAAAEAEEHAEDHDADERVEKLRRISQRPLTTLASLTLLQVVCQAAAVVLAYVIGRDIGGRPIGVLAAAICVVLLFVGVALSRSRAMLQSDAMAVGVVPILSAVAPLAIVTTWVSALARRSAPPAPDPDVDEQQLLALVGEAATINSEEEALIKRVVAFDDTTVGDIMTPRTDLVTLRSGFAVRDALEVASLHGLSRIPVTGPDSDVDDIIGAVHVKDLMVAHLDSRSRHDIDLWLRHVPVVPESQRIANLLTDLKTGDLHLAIVADEHGGVAGVVTLEDILEEIVGEIEDEFDRPEPAVEVLDDRTVRADGRVEISRIEELLGVQFPDGDYRTVAGCVFSHWGRVPEVGDVLTLDGFDLEFEVIRMHGRRIADVQLRRSSPFASPLAERQVEETTL